MILKTEIIFQFHPRTRKLDLKLHLWIFKKVRGIPMLKIMTMGSDTDIYPYLDNIFILYPLKTPESQSFFGIFKDF